MPKVKTLRKISLYPITKSDKDSDLEVEFNFPQSLEQLNDELLSKKPAPTVKRNFKATKMHRYAPMTLTSQVHNDYSVMQSGEDYQEVVE